MPDAAESYSFARWVDYLLDAPMMFYKRDDAWLPANGRPFRDWMENGHEGRFPTWEDWDLHLTSVFPEVRVKHAIEVRGADCVPADLAFASHSSIALRSYTRPSSAVAGSSGSSCVIGQTNSSAAESIALRINLFSASAAPDASSIMLWCSSPPTR